MRPVRKYLDKQYKMSIRTIPAGTQIFLTKKLTPIFSLQPGKLLLNDSLYVAYDVRVRGVIVIPRGTRVVGDWITEGSDSLPCAAQLQVNRVYLSGTGQPMFADSQIYTNISGYNREEVNNSPFLYNIKRMHSKSGLRRRIARVQNRSQVLADYRPNTVYLDIDTTEIPVTLTEDFSYRECPIDNDYNQNKC